MPISRLFPADRAFLREVSGATVLYPVNTLPMDTPVKLIVGLGNPGAGYANTRHNAGADFVTLLADRHHRTLTADGKFFGLVTRISIGAGDVRLLIPTTFMNASGKAVAAMGRFYRITPEEMLIVHDELDLPPGTARLKTGGGHGGHNGLKDIVQALGNNRNFARLRIGIGHPGNAGLVSGYVLRKAPENERELMAGSIDSALRVLPLVVGGEWNRAMKELHTHSTTRLRHAT